MGLQSFQQGRDAWAVPHWVPASAHALARSLMSRQRSPCLGPVVWVAELTIRALLAARAHPRPAPVGCCCSTTVPLCEGSVSRSADGASMPLPRPTRVLARALCALRTARGLVRIAPSRRAASASFLAASTRSHPLPRIGRVRADRALTAARAHLRMYPPAPPPCSTISWECSASGTRQCPPHAAMVCGARYALSGRHAHVTASPRHCMPGARFAPCLRHARVSATPAPVCGDAKLVPYAA